MSEPRFPSFPDGYRQRWKASGFWAQRTLHGCFDETVAAMSDALAVITEDRRITFREFKEESDALAAGLIGVGIGPGSLVSVQLPNWAELCLLQIALSRIGAVIHPMHTVYRERETASLLAFCESDAVVVPGTWGGHDYAGAVNAVRDRLQSLSHVVVARGGGDGDLTVDGLIAGGREHLDRLHEATPDPDDVFYMNFTSGTEGDPKGFMHTHNSLVSLFKLTADFLRASAPGAVNLACSPMTHSFGHFTTYQTVTAGIPMVLVDRYRPLDVLRLIERERVTSLSGTPAHLSGILHHTDFASFDTSSVRNVGVGGARSAPELIEELERVWGIKTMNTYGLGENIVHTRTMPFDPPDKIRDTVGRPIMGAELRVVDPEDRSTDLEPGTVGEIVFRGPTLFVGYYKRPELTAATRDEEGWFYTGDLGSVDEEGFLVFAGRRSEVINRGGTKIYPKEIEDLLDGHPKVREVAVVGIPDERLGEKVCAYVVPAPGEEPTLEELGTWLEEQKVMRYNVPEHLVLVDELPMTPTGKVRKAAIQQDAARRAEAAERA